MTVEKTPKYLGAFAHQRADGSKPWVRESYHFGDTTYSIVYAKTPQEAKNMYGRMHLERVRVRRATNADIEAYDHDYELERSEVRIGRDTDDPYGA